MKLEVWNFSQNVHFNTLTHEQMKSFEYHTCHANFIQQNNLNTNIAQGPESWKESY